MKYLFLLSLTFVLFSCDSPEKEPATEVEETNQLELTVVINDVQVRDQPGLEGKEIQKVKEGDILIYLDKISDFSTPLMLRGITFNEPWLKVKNSEGQIGWIYAGCVKFDTNGAGKELAQQVITQRLANFFGEKSGRLIKTYADLYTEAETALEFAEMYRTGLELRDSLIVELNEIDLTGTPVLPDMFWIDEPLPGLVPTQVAEGTTFHLFYDYKNLAQKVKQTVGEEDDEFVQLCFDIYKQDSIEYFYPSWFLQTSDYGGHSLLGEGIHLNIIGQMDQIMAKSELFGQAIQDFKAAILEDIVAGTEYWRGQADILKELNTIIQNDYAFLTPADKIALTERVKMFENPLEYELLLNSRENVE